MNLLGMVQRYQRTPSELLAIEDEYTSYCLDEACAYIMSRLDAGEEMAFTTRYSSFSEMYSKFD